MLDFETDPGLDAESRGALSTSPAEVDTTVPPRFREELKVTVSHENDVASEELWE